MLLNWLRKGASAAILAELASGARPVSHATLDAHPRRGAAEFLRQMLVANGALAPRHEGLARLERWVADALAQIDPPGDRRLVQAYATWEVLARLRRRAESGSVVRTANAKLHIGSAARLLAWLSGRGTTLEELTQPDLDDWLAEGAPSSYDVADFVRWAAARGFVGTLEVPRPASRTGSALGDEQRWRIVGRLLHDDALELTDRVAGCLVLLFAQQLSRIVAIGVDQVVSTGDEIRLRLGGEDVLIPDPLGALLTELVARGRRYVGVGTPAGSPWLFPGLHPGRPLTAARLGDRLVALGIDGRAGRRAALMHLAAQLPAAVLAEMLGLTPGTAVRWVRAAGGDWASYAAEVARGVIARDAECSSR